MNPSMQRTKVLGVVAALLAAATATVLLAGGASAATWHVYEGDVYPGHAYAFAVPENAESVEVALVGAETGRAALSLHAPGGEKLGFYELEGASAAASVANPAAGRYVLYVYDVVDGALSIRVNSKAQPTELDLGEVALARQDVKVGEFPAGTLAQQITAELEGPTVFVTLLYEGSAKDLDATVASEQGPVVTIVDESATAFSPGVWTSLTGERAFDASNLAGVKYTIEARAAHFEGRMVLTTLALDLDEPVAPQVSKTPMPPAPANAPRGTGHAHAAHTEEQAGASFALEQMTAVAFDAPAGTLVLVDPAALERMEAEENGEEYDYGDDCQYEHALVSIFAPDDTLVATVTLDHDTPTAEVALPVAGEYVAFAHSSEREVVLAKLVGASAAPALRFLELEEVETRVATSAMFSGSEAEIDLERVPVQIGLRLEGVGAIANARLSNDAGEVAYAEELVSLGGSTPLSSGEVDYANLAAGRHTLQTEGVFDGEVVLTTLHYVRASAIVVETVHAAHAEQEDGSEPAEPEEPTPPLPPLPAAGPVLGLDLGL